MLGSGFQGLKLFGWDVVQGKRAGAVFCVSLGKRRAWEVQNQNVLPWHMNHELLLIAIAYHDDDIVPGSGTWDLRLLRHCPIPLIKWVGVFPGMKEIQTMN